MTTDYTTMDSGEMLTALGDDAGKWATAFMQILEKRGGPFDWADMMGWFANAIEHSHTLRRSKEMLASEAVYGVLAWLTTRQEEIVLGRYDNAGPAAEAAAEFCKVNNLESPRSDWTSRLTHPVGFHPTPPQKTSDV